MLTILLAAGRALTACCKREREAGPSESTLFTNSRITFGWLEISFYYGFKREREETIRIKEEKRLKKKEKKEGIYLYSTSLWKETRQRRKEKSWREENAWAGQDQQVRSLSLSLSLIYRWWWKYDRASRVFKSCFGWWLFGPRSRVRSRGELRRCYSCLPVGERKHFLSESLAWKSRRIRARAYLLLYVLRLKCHLVREKRREIPRLLLLLLLLLSDIGDRRNWRRRFQTRFPPCTTE